MKHERALAYIAFAIVCLVWGTTYLAIRVAVVTIPPFLLTGLRYSIAGIILLIAARVRNEPLPRDPRVLANLCFIGFLMVGVGNLSVVVAEQWVPSGMAALFVATAPFWATMLERMRTYGERIDKRAVIGMLAGFIGVSMLVTPGASEGKFDAKFILGAVIIQFGSIGWQYGTLRAKYTTKGLPIVTSVAIQMTLGGLIVDAIGLAIGEASRVVITPRGLLSLAYLTLFGSVLAYTSYVYAASRLRTANMSLYAYVNPVVAVILGFFILNERLTVVSVIAMCVILCGVALVQTSGFRRRRLPTMNTQIAQKNAA